MEHLEVGMLAHEPVQMAREAEAPREPFPQPAGAQDRRTIQTLRARKPRDICGP